MAGSKQTPWTRGIEEEGEVRSLFHFLLSLFSPHKYWILDILQIFSFVLIQRTPTDLDISISARHSLPSPESLRPLVKLDEEEITDALRPDQAEVAATSKASKIWRALRVASRDRFHLFNKLVDTPDENRNELEMLFEIEETEQETKRIKLEENINSTPKDKDRLSVVPETRPPGTDRRATATPLLALGSSGETIRAKESSTENPMKLPSLEKRGEHQQQPQRIENVTTLDDSSMAPNQATMKLHRIENFVVG